MDAERGAKVNYPTATHRIDPISSAYAEATHTLSGKRASNAERVLRAVEGNPGAVASELVSPSGLDVVEVRRRLDDLHKLGLAVQGAISRRAGRAQVTWWPVSMEQGRLM